jgi:hypothetical protein
MSREPPLPDPELLSLVLLPPPHAASNIAALATTATALTLCRNRRI